MKFGAVFTATILAARLDRFIEWLWANGPAAPAPSMGQHRPAYGLMRFLPKVPSSVWGRTISRRWQYMSKRSLTGLRKIFPSRWFVAGFSINYLQVSDAKMMAGQRPAVPLHKGKFLKKDIHHEFCL